MDFNPANVTFPLGSVQHIFYRHKVDWGFIAGDNWNNIRATELINRLETFIQNDADFNAVGTYRAEGAYLLVQHVTHLCLIIHRGGPSDYQVWSGWTLSAAQYDYVINPPHRLGGGALVIFGHILEKFVNEGPTNPIIAEFNSIYKSNQMRFSQIEEESLMDFFGLVDNYLTPSSVLYNNPGKYHVLEENVVKEHAQKTLAALERNSI